MPLDIIEKKLNGLILFQPKVFQDERGFFMESYRADLFKDLGLPIDFMQDNHSLSIQNTIRGLHFQWDKPMGKLLRVTRGAAKVIELDIRKNSPTLGQYYTTELSESNKRLLWVPPGFANGFRAIEDKTELLYKCTALWNPAAESSIRWDDPALGIDWGINKTDKIIVSPKDASAQTLNQWLETPESDYFTY